MGTEQSRGGNEPETGHPPPPCSPGPSAPTVSPCKDSHLPCLWSRGPGDCQGPHRQRSAPCTPVAAPGLPGGRRWGPRDQGAARGPSTDGTSSEGRAQDGGAAEWPHLGRVGAEKADWLVSLGTAHSCFTCVRGSRVVPRSDQLGDVT